MPRPFSAVLARAFLVWTLVGLFSIQAYWVGESMRGAAVALRPVATRILVDVWLWALFTPAMLQAAERWPLLGSRGRVARSLPVHLAVLALVTAVCAVADLLVSNAFRPGEGTFARSFFGLLTLNLISYALVVAVGHARLLVSRLVAEEARSAQLEARLATAQLASLRAQLHPHFFFNTLNALAEMIHRDPDAADRMVTRLAAFLRRSLDSGDLQEVPLGEELEALSAYLDVVHLRFGERIRVSLTTDPEILGMAVPPLILQPLVENALKHGLEPKEGPGFIDVLAELQGSRLDLQVRDDGVGLPDPRAIAERVGLRNTRERLAQLYGEAGALSIRSRPGGGVIASVTLPARPFGDPAPVPARSAAAPGGARRYAP